MQSTSLAATVTDVQLPVSANNLEDDHPYEIVGMTKTSTEQKTEEEYEEIELSNNSAYGI